MEYFDLLSGEPVLLEGVGHVRSPKIRELFSSNQMGMYLYRLYVSFLTWDKEDVVKYDLLSGIKSAEKLLREDLSVFDAITIIPLTREFAMRVLSFFITETISWDEKRMAFILTNPGGESEEPPEEVGRIDRRNFDRVKEAILEMCYVGIGKDKAPIGHSTKDSEDAWNRIQGYLKEQAKSPKEDKPEYHIANIISKLCSAHPSYNLLNVFDLTVFQLYDAFFQLEYIRGSDLSERIFSIHGGKDFDIEKWLKPINQDQ